MRLPFSWTGRVLALAVATAAIGFGHLYYPIYEAESRHSVTLHWNAVVGATSYNVYRGTKSGGPYEKIAKAGIATYVDVPVPGGATFYYVVTTVRGKTESGYSAEVKAVVP